MVLDTERICFRNNLSVVEHHGLLHFFNEPKDLGRARFAKTGPTAQTSTFSLSK